MKNKKSEHIIYICTGSKCDKKGAKECYKKVKKEIKKLGNSEIEVIKTECTDRCSCAPVLCLQPVNKWLLNYDQDEVTKIVLQLGRK
ncbi:(2Fe-2S) ferredoxin domain-containing protein [Pedobacter alpinus]|uniref:(2Fe-2S) ferredoxin domain-containing protein n=1 Tax=Pedobacter alpinus TaxID=1590643 RepID=A0ABW5TVR3_9SPHI